MAVDIWRCHSASTWNFSKSTWSNSWFWCPKQSCHAVTSLSMSTPSWHPTLTRAIKDYSKGRLSSIFGFKPYLIIIFQELLILSRIQELISAKKSYISSIWSNTSKPKALQVQVFTSLLFVTSFVNDPGRFVLWLP